MGSDNIELPARGWATGQLHGEPVSRLWGANIECEVVKMALDMYLEVKGSQADWEVAKAIRYELSMPPLDEHRPVSCGGPWGNGEVFAEAQWGPVRSRNEILAEGMHGCSFAVTCEFSFRINNSKYAEAVATIKMFSARLTERTDMLFVLSFQYVEVHAIRDRARGFEWFWNQPR